MVNTYLIELSANKTINLRSILNAEVTAKKCIGTVIANSRNIRFFSLGVSAENVKIALKIINTNQTCDVYRPQSHKLIISGFVRKFKSAFENELKLKNLLQPHYSLRIIDNYNEYIDLVNT